jgi:hypothetical protein
MLEAPDIRLEFYTAENTMSNSKRDENEKRVVVLEFFLGKADFP